jgi:carbon storage regulator
MLIITRKEGEAFYISGGIKVAILSINGRQIRVGVLAPDHDTILRQELMTKQDYIDMECESCI